MVSSMYGWHDLKGLIERSGTTAHRKDDDGVTHPLRFPHSPTLLKGEELLANLGCIAAGYGHSPTRLIGAA